MQQTWTPPPLTQPLLCNPAVLHSALEEWEARIKDLALISKLAAQLWGYLGVGGCCSCWRAGWGAAECSFANACLGKAGAGAAEHGAAVCATCAGVKVLLHASYGAAQHAAPRCCSVSHSCSAAARLAPMVHSFCPLPCAHCCVPPTGWRWYVSFWRLVLFAVLLLPGFMQMVAFYFFSPRMLRSIPYGLLVRLPVRSIFSQVDLFGGIARLMIEQRGFSARSAAGWLAPHVVRTHIYISMRCCLLLKDPSLSTPTPPHHPPHPTPRTPPHAAAQPPRCVPAAQGVASGGAAPNRHLHHRRGVDHWLQRSGRLTETAGQDSWDQLRTLLASAALLTSAAWDAGWGRVFLAQLEQVQRRVDRSCRHC